MPDVHEADLAREAQVAVGGRGLGKGTSLPGEGDLLNCWECARRMARVETWHGVRKARGRQEAGKKEEHWSAGFCP